MFSINKSEEFLLQVRQNIKDLANDKQLKKLTREWFDASCIYNYSYNFTWLGRPVIQYPQDLIAMQEIIWRVNPDLIIETGVAHGGSIIFYASLLELLGGKGEVIGIDIDIRKHNRIEIENHKMYKRISLIEGSSTDNEVLEIVKAIASKKKNVLVVLDSYHTNDHVYKELVLYSPLVTKGSYLVVFDTVIENMKDSFFHDRPWGKGDNPQTAVDRFLCENNGFIVDEIYNNKLLITAALNGYLKCIDNERG